MGAFSYISTASEEEVVERYRILDRLGRALRETILPHMPSYIYGTVNDMGIPDQSITGCWVHLPPAEKGLVKSKLSKAISRCRHSGADVVVVDKSLPVSLHECRDLVVSNGMFYTPFAFIDGLKKVTALMGFDFKTCNVCIVNAATEVGMVMTELLLGEVMHLILCTEDRDSMNERVYKSLLKYGISPIIMNNYRKAVRNSDVLIYTGGADMAELSSYIAKKILIANITGEVLKLQKDLMSFDEVLLQSKRCPVISGDRVDSDAFMTSRIWEGALLCISGISPDEYSINQAEKIYRVSKECSIDVKAVVRDGKPLDKYSIYKYR